MRPEELNQTSDEELFRLIDQVFTCRDDGGAEPPPLARFLTLDMLGRVDKRLTYLSNSGCYNHSKHRALAYALCSLSGVCAPPDERDVEKIGNHAALWLHRNLTLKERLLQRNIRNRANLQQKRTELRQSCFVISSMGRLEHFDGPFESCALSAQLRHPPRVPYTSSTLPPTMSYRDLKEAANEADRKASAAEAECRREKRRGETERKRAHSARQRSEKAASKVAAARKRARSLERERSEVEARAAESLKKLSQDAKAERERLERLAENRLKDEEAKVIRLGTMVTAAAQEAGMYAQKLNKLQKKADTDIALAQRELGELEQEVELQRADRIRVERESAQQLTDARAKALRLGGHVAAALQEAALHAQKEAAAMLKLEQERERAEVEADMRREQASAERARFRAEARESAQALAAARAKVLCLGSQVTAASLEAGRFARAKEAAETAMAEQHRELEKIEEEREYLQLKAESEAEARKLCAKQRDAAIQMREAVKATSQKRLQAKKELEDRVSMLASDYDEIHMELMHERNLKDANAEAAAKLESMPTWRHERRQGRRGGGMQLEFTHRLAILEQHANGTPSSAIGRNIVSIVKKAAPWLQPVEPSRREVMQIGFELPTLEEALAARRTASAHRVRLLGFDETTDSQDPVITSNVQVEDTAGAQPENVVLKGAYLSSRGGTSAAVAAEIEGKCFARLRELLLLWRKYHDNMFPAAQWTGPDPSNCSIHRLAAGGALMSDTCNGARKTKILLEQMVQEQAEAALRQTLGDEEWQSLAHERRAELLRVHRLDCHHHLRNIWLAHMSKKQVHAYITQEACT